MKITDRRKYKKKRFLRQTPSPGLDDLKSSATWSFPEPPQMFPISGPLSELDLSGLSPSPSFSTATGEGTEQDGGGRSVAEGDGEVKVWGYKYARRLTDEAECRPTNREKERARPAAKAKSPPPFSLCACGWPTLDQSRVQLSLSLLYLSFRLQILHVLLLYLGRYSQI